MRVLVFVVRLFAALLQRWQKRSIPAMSAEPTEKAPPAQVLCAVTKRGELWIEGPKLVVKTDKSIPPPDGWQCKNEQLEFAGDISDGNVAEREAALRAAIELLGIEEVEHWSCNAPDWLLDIVKLEKMVVVMRILVERVEASDDSDDVAELLRLAANARHDAVERQQRARITASSAGYYMHLAEALEARAAELQQ